MMNRGMQGPIGMPGKGPKNNRYFNIKANNAQSYLNGVKAMKSSSRIHMNNGMRSQFKIPGMKNMNRLGGKSMRG